MTLFTICCKPQAYACAHIKCNLELMTRIGAGLESIDYFLLFGSRIFLRMRNDFGVISKYSSLSINSRAVSKVNLRGGISIIASSDALERTLVSFFFLNRINIDIIALAIAF